MCVGKRRRRGKPVATSIDEIDSRWDKLFIPRDKFSDKTVGSRMLLTSNGIFMSSGEIERRTTYPPSGPIAQSAERKTRTRKQRANKPREEGGEFPTNRCYFEIIIILRANFRIGEKKVTCEFWKQWNYQNSQNDQFIIFVTYRHGTVYF